MLNKLRKRISIELKHLHALGNDTKNLLLSYTIYQISTSLLYTFINVYLYKNESRGIELVLLYNISIFVVLPIFFYINGLLLKKFSVKTLYWIGCIFQGISSFSVIYFKSTPIATILNGAFLGMGMGLFWANKNTLTQTLTKGKNRVYYKSMESTLTIIVGLVVPVVSGWFISYGEISKIYSVDTAYRIIAILGIVLLIYAGKILNNSNGKQLKVKGMTKLKNKVSKLWWANRIIAFTVSIISGINSFVPSILIVYFGKNEGVVGTVMSFASILAALTLYVVGRKSKIGHMLHILIISTMIYTVSSVLLSINFALLIAIIHVVILNITGTFRFDSVFVTMMETMDIEMERQGIESVQPFIIDNEISFNVGRVFGIFVFWIIMRQYSMEFALRYIYTVMAVILLTLVIPMRYMVNTIKSNSSSNH